MPAKSQQQLKLIYAKRNQYGNKSKTPEKWKWVWDEEWTEGAKFNKLPEKVEEENRIITRFSDYDTVNEYYFPEKEERIDNPTSAIERLESPKVTYMELRESSFKCGACEYGDKNSYCNNKYVKSYVNAEKGCCNLYEPKAGDLLDNSEWAANKK